MMEKNGMRKRRVGNYLKEYPHVYEAFRKEIRKNNICMVGIITSLVIFALPALFFWLTGEEDMCTMFVMFLVIYAFLCSLLLLAWLGAGLISLEELELMEKDLSGEKEWVQNWGYSTKESFLIGFYRIPRKGLNAVHLAKHYSAGRIYTLVRWVLEFCYEDGTRLSVVNTTVNSENNFAIEHDFIQMVHRYDDSVKIDEKTLDSINPEQTQGYDDSVKIHECEAMRAYFPLFWPFQNSSGEAQFVRKETVEKMNALSKGNRLLSVIHVSEPTRQA